MRYCYIISIVLFLSCRQEPRSLPYSYSDSSGFALADTIHQVLNKDADLQLRIVEFARSLIGTKYQFGCASPAAGFDCSGFVNYVFGHFDIEVPRSSVEFTNKCCDVPLNESRPGDLILFTGTNSNIRTVGHIGIIVSNDSAGVQFIHASSGKEMQVMISRLKDAYTHRFVKVVRIVR